MTNTQSNAPQGTAKALLVGGVIAGPLFTLDWIIGGALTAHYDPMRHLISQISLGEFGWIQQFSFFVPGALIVGFALALWRTLRPLRAFWGPLVVAVAGLALIGAGVFLTDPANGFPAGTPIIPTERTTHGVLHDLFGGIFIFGLPIAALVFARSLGKLAGRKWAIFSVLAGVATIVVFFLAKLNPDDLSQIGLRQRLGITINLIWLTAVALRTMKTTRHVAHH